MLSAIRSPWRRWCGFSDEELKHQALFRRIEDMVAETLPGGYRFTADPDAVAEVVLTKGTWAVLGLTLDIELFTQLHYRESIDPDGGLSDLYKDVFLYHWKEESQHAILDELEWVRHDAELTADERDKGVDEFIELVAAIDGILQAQATADADYFAANCGPYHRQRRDDGHRSKFLEGLSLAIYPLGRTTPAIRQGFVGPNHRRARSTYPGSARHIALSTSMSLTSTQSPLAAAQYAAVFFALCPPGVKSGRNRACPGTSAFLR